MTVEDRARREIWIVSGPVSARALVLWAIVVFAAGFFDGRQMENLTEMMNVPAAALITPTSGPTDTNNSVGITPADTATNAIIAPSHVSIKLLKFSPERIEVKSGQTIEWANSDLTPHNVTTVGTQEMKSGTINAGASWSHTFSQPGSFPYYCSFHPEMKGIVIVQ